ncbi:hypothetical protein [Pontibacter liquoris]|uniref:hypothetical protein n=1 Tax=Pontibacter liquoris TaxID=2905677 RepID=UPI001FA708A9|nr:hypothetical protein [Pontibacter liquoris]
MKKLFRPSFAFLLMGSLTFAASSCGGSDDPKPIVEEQELITTVQLNLVPNGKGQNVTATFRDPDGVGGAAPTVDALNLAPNTTYTGAIVLLDESKTPAVDQTAEVSNESDEHEFFYEPSSGLKLTVQKTDLDKNNRPIGLQTTFTTTTTSSGTLRVTLKHQPNLKGATSDITKGETDVQVDFPVVIQ